MTSNKLKKGAHAIQSAENYPNRVEGKNCYKELFGGNQIEKAADFP